MKGINKAKQIEIEIATEELGKAATLLDKAIENYNDALAGVRENLEEAQREYNQAIGEMKELYDGIASEASEYYAERSEKWQEGDAGVEYQGWINQIEDFSTLLYEIEIDVPDDLDVEIIDLEQLEFPDNSPQT